MFESIKQWFASLEIDSKLFNDYEDEALRSALASVLYHVINSDESVSNREKKEFTHILIQEFNLNAEQAEHLFNQAKSSSSNLDDDLNIIDGFLKAEPSLRMQFMKYLNHLIGLDGVKKKELDVFYSALHKVFPNLRIKY